MPPSQVNASHRTLIGVLVHRCRTTPAAASLAITSFTFTCACEPLPGRQRRLSLWSFRHSLEPAFADTSVAESSRSTECPNDKSKNRRCSLGRGSHAQIKLDKIVARMAPTDVFRHLGSRKSTRVWWTGYTGDGGTELRFEEREYSSRSYERTIVLERNHAWSLGLSAREEEMPPPCPGWLSATAVEDKNSCFHPGDYLVCFYLVRTSDPGPGKIH